MNSTTNTLSIEPRTGSAGASSGTETVSAWAAKLGWIVWYSLQSYGARRALREMRLMGIGVGPDHAQFVDGKDFSGQEGARR